ncbi:MAG TPA: sulfatase, partial [Verrucomicrobiales bacterium]|nr:sulfatase [Verrucomicrobiales bacterium]
MSPQEYLTQTRRDFLATSSCGLGGAALASLLMQDGVLAADPLAARRPHFAPKAERCIFIFLEGGPSQMDLFDPKPLLNKYDGQPLPDSIVGDAKFAFLQKDTATVMGTKRVFQKHGQCGMEISDLLPRIATCADDIALIRSMHTTQFNHLPGQLMLNCGAPLLGRPSVGSWLAYGLGNA